MASIEVSPDVRAQLEADAARESRTVDELVDRLLREYLRTRQRQKIARETEAFNRLHPALVQTHLGTWVAIHEGQLVDTDGDLAALYARMRGRFGRTSVLLRQVETPVDRDLRQATPRTDYRAV
ncbi:MAG: hypothetical protein ACKVVP_17045 [Chloroflexota bacterium]